MNNNDFEPLENSLGKFEIAHLKDLSIKLNITFDNGDDRTITVNMRPTNHLYSREVVKEDWVNKGSLIKSQLWLTSYVHHEANFQSVINPTRVKEHRIFCEDKWNDSFHFPQFVKLIEENPTQTTVLANEGDDKTCLSGIFEVDNHPDKVYLVFFTLKKVNSKEINMMIESGYCVSKEKHKKARKLISNDRDGRRPFLIVIKNIQEGRLPLEGKKLTKRKNNFKKKKSKKP